MGGDGLLSSQRAPELRPAKGRRRRRRQRFAAAVPEPVILTSPCAAVTNSQIKSLRGPARISLPGYWSRHTTQCAGSAVRLAVCGHYADHIKTMHPLPGLSQCELHRAKELCQADPLEQGWSRWLARCGRVETRLSPYHRQQSLTHQPAMSLVSGPGRAGVGAMPAEMQLFVDKHVRYIQSLDTVRAIFIELHATTERSPR